MDVIGLDLSSTCTGIALPDGTTDHHAPKGDLLDRCVATRDWVRDYLAPGCDLLLVEAIGTNRVNTAIALAYVHCLVDLVVVVNDVPVVKVPPNVLKKFATGKGTSDKHAMTVAAIRNGWACDGDEGTTDDEADAWWLRALGRHLLDAPVVDDTAYRRTVMNDLRAPS